MPGCIRSAGIRPYHMTADEIAAGWVFDQQGVRGPLPRLAAGIESPLSALQALLRDWMLQGKCIVSFSGGRDSSALLAVACQVARSSGLPPPVALTLRYRNAPGTEESEWQEMVIRHLAVEDWLKLDLRSESTDLLGGPASSSLRQHGIFWPPALHAASAWLDHARGSTLITGDGGDEILGPWRTTALRQVIRILRRRPKALGLDALGQLRSDFTSQRRRQAAVRSRLESEGMLSWLQDAPRDRLLNMLADELADLPLSWRESIRLHPDRRRLVLGAQSRAALGADHDVTYEHPFLHTRFVDAVARDGGALGYPDRTAAMHRIFSGLLPNELLSRSTKASFNHAYFGALTRQFAQSWSGDGVDRDVVKVEVLKSLWGGDLPPAGTLPLLQSAWLVSHGLPTSGTLWT